MGLPTVWTNIKGEQLQIKDMGSDHVKNCVFFLALKGFTEGIYPLASVGVGTSYPEAFRQELRRRGDILVNTYGEGLVLL